MEPTQRRRSAVRPRSTRRVAAPGASICSAGCGRLELARCKACPPAGMDTLSPSYRPGQIEPTTSAPSRRALPGYATPRGGLSVAVSGAAGDAARPTSRAVRPRTTSPARSGRHPTPSGRAAPSAGPDRRTGARGCPGRRAQPLIDTRNAASPSAIVAMRPSLPTTSGSQSSSAASAATSSSAADREAAHVASHHVAVAGVGGHARSIP